MRKKNISYGRQAPVRNPQVLGINLAGLLYESHQPYLIIVCKFTDISFGKRASTDKLYAVLLILFNRNFNT